jgi:hypothetical protein
MMQELSPTSYTFRMEALGTDDAWAPTRPVQRLRKRLI